MKMIAIVMIILVFACADARTLPGSSALVDRPNCAGAGPLFTSICEFFRDITRLTLDFPRSYAILKDAVKTLSHFIKTSTIDDFLNASEGVPLFLVKHFPDMMKVITRGSQLFVHFADFILSGVEEDLKRSPLEVGKILLVNAISLPIVISVEILEGIVIGVSRSGFKDYHKHIVSLQQRVAEFFKYIQRKVRKFQCSDLAPILSQDKCNVIFRLFESVMVAPIMKLLRFPIDFLEKSIIPILRKVSSLHFIEVCVKVLPEKTCAKFNMFLKDKDSFSVKEMGKVLDNIHSAIHWIEGHIFSDTDNANEIEKV